MAGFRSSKGITAGGAAVALFLDDKAFMQQLAGTRQTLNRFGRGLGGLATGLGAGALGFGGLTFAIGNFIEKAANAERVMLKMQQVFGDSANSASEWGRALAQATGQGELAIATIQTTFQGFFKGMDFGGKEAERLSRSITSLSLDFAATQPGVNDIEAQRRFISGLEGEKEALDRYGINLSQTSLQQELYAQGVDKLVRNATEHEKVLARIAIIQDAMGKQGALGKAVQNADTLAAAINGIRGSFEDLSAVLGGFIAGELGSFFAEFRTGIKAFGEWLKMNRDGVIWYAKLAFQVTAATAAFFAVKSVVLATNAAFLAGWAAVLKFSAAITGLFSGMSSLSSAMFILQAQVVGMQASFLPLVAVVAIAAAVIGKNLTDAIYDAKEAMTELINEQKNMRIASKFLLKWQREADNINVDNAENTFKELGSALLLSNSGLDAAVHSQNMARKNLANLNTEYDSLKERINSADTAGGVSTDEFMRFDALPQIIKHAEGALDDWERKVAEERRVADGAAKAYEDAKENLEELTKAREEAADLKVQKKFEDRIETLVREQRVLRGLITEEQALVEKLMYEGYTENMAQQEARFVMQNKALKERAKNLKEVKALATDVFQGIAGGGTLGTQQFFQFRSEGQGNLIDLGKQQVDLLGQINAKIEPVAAGAF